jgi:hypothetical protein
MFEMGESLFAYLESIRDFHFFMTRESQKRKESIFVWFVNVR